jgi:hypothetical protein
LKRPGTVQAPRHDTTFGCATLHTTKKERKKRREGNKPEEEEEHTSSLDDPQDVHRAISVAESGGSAVRT